MNERKYREADSVFWSDIVEAGERVRLSGDLLGSVTVPTPFLWGENDGFGGEAVARGVVDAMPRAELELVPEAGHLPWIDDPRGLAQRVRAYLSA